MTILLQAKNISFKHHNKSILDDVSLSLKEKELITIVGPNGAGKSTLVKILLGLLKPSSGQVIKKQKIKIAYTPQTFTTNPYIPIKVLDFLQLNQNNNITQVKTVGKQTQINHLLEQSLHNVSGGELQKILLTRALLQQPNVLILDEPAQSLDIDGQMKFYQLIKNINQQYRCAILMVSHDLHWVMRDSNQVLCLYRHVCCLGKPSDVLQNTQFKAFFGKQMAELTAIYQHHHNHNHDT